MALAVGVVFSPGGKVYSFDPERARPALERVRDLPDVARPRARPRRPGEPRARRGDRPAAAQDRAPRHAPRRRDRRRTRRRERGHARPSALALRGNGERGVPAPSRAEVVFDGSRVVLSFRAEERVELKHLAPDLQQRDRPARRAAPGDPREARAGVRRGGLCGERKCCNRFPSHEQPITLRMAKDQDLPMNPGRITGLCGRLRCCLAFEHPVYRSFRDRAPGRRPLGGDAPGPRRRALLQVLEDALVVRHRGRRAGRRDPGDDAQELSAGGR